MSINYRAIVFYGWKISRKEFDELEEDLQMCLIEDETVICQNCMTSESDYGFVFANAIVQLDEAINPVSQITDIECIEWSDEWYNHLSRQAFNRLFPSREGENPQWYTMIQIS